MQTTHFTIWLCDAVNDAVLQGDDALPAAAPVLGKPGRGEDVDAAASSASVWSECESLKCAAASQGETGAAMSNHLTPFSI